VSVKKQSADPIFEMRIVALGKEIGTNYEVLNGLTKNEEIVTNGTFTVDAAAQLQGKKSMMNQPQTNENLTTSSFGVLGNCTMCKATIEKAANSVLGVFNAVWDVDKKNIAVSFDDTKTAKIDIHKAIAASGYDTEKMKGEQKAYDGLPKCYLYTRDMKMNQ